MAAAISWRHFGLCVEMLREQAEPELIESMTRNIAAADKIIGQFVDFARVGSDEAIQMGDLTGVARSVVADLDLQANINLTLQALPPFALRPVAIRRALANLLENARRYATGEVAVCTEQVGDWLEVTVLDRGPGIPADNLACARQPFVRLEEARGAKPSAGLGLAIVERIAHLHGGTHILRNREGGGLAASLRLPLVARLS